MIEALQGVTAAAIAAAESPVAAAVEAAVERMTVAPDHLAKMLGEVIPVDPGEPWCEALQRHKSEVEQEENRV